MANYYATWRSSYFPVRDETEFRKWAERLAVEIVGDMSTGEPRFALLPKDGEDSGGIPDRRAVDDDNPPLCTPPEDIDEVMAEESEEISFEQELSKHLKEGWVVVLMEIGREKLRYVSGVAIAVNWKGDTKRVALDSIYNLVGELGDSYTRAEY